MRFHILSDLHQEFGEIDVPVVECDCVILAGDISTKSHGFDWIRRRFEDVPVIYICGNHEYYGEKLPRLSERLKEQAQGTNIHFLENESVVIGGVSIFGATLWTDMALQGEWLDGAAEAQERMNDYKRIRNSAQGYRKLRASHTRLLHLDSIEAMKRFSQLHSPANSLIVTHHAPSILSLPESRRSESISCAYASRLDGLIETWQPHLWVHGHIHRSNDYKIGSTRIVSNPRAYPDAPNLQFEPELVIEM